MLRGGGGHREVITKENERTKYRCRTRATESARTLIDELYYYVEWLLCGATIFNHFFLCHDARELIIQKVSEKSHLEFCRVNLYQNILNTPVNLSRPAG